MNGEKILLAIGDIKDQYVMEFADVKLYKRKQKSQNAWVKLVSVAASIVLIISSALLVNEYQHKNVTPSHNMMIISGKLYEIVPSDDNKIQQNTSYKDILEEHGLSYPIEEDELGDSLGTYKSENNRSYPVYDYKPYEGKSVLVVQDGSKLQYALFCNLDNNNTILMSELLELYGFANLGTVYEISIDNKFISNPVSMQAILSEIKQLPLSADYIDADNTTKMEIVIKGVNTDVLVFDYYPERNVLSKSLTFYQVSPALSKLLEMQ